MQIIRGGLYATVCQVWQLKIRGCVLSGRGGSLMRADSIENSSCDSWTYSGRSVMAAADTGEVVKHAEQRDDNRSYYHKDPKS